MMFCRSFARCHVSSKQRYLLLCPIFLLEVVMSSGNESEDSEKEGTVRRGVTKKKSCSDSVSLLRVEINIRGQKKGQKEGSRPLDCGSRKSYIKQSTAKEIGSTPIEETGSISHSLSGGSLIDSRPP